MQKLSWEGGSTRRGYMYMVFPVVMYGCESWTVKKAKRRRIDAFELWCWRLLRVPWTAGRSNQSWVFIGRTDVETETPILWPADEKSWLIWKDPDAGKYWGQEEKGRTEDEMVGWHHRLSGWVWVNPGSWWWTGRPGVLRFMGSQRVGHDWTTELMPCFYGNQPYSVWNASRHNDFLSLSFSLSLPSSLSSCPPVWKFMPFFLLLVL